MDTTTSCRTQRRNPSRPERPQPQPLHTRGTFHRRPKPLYTEKCKVSCSGFLPNTSPMQHSCSHYNAFCSITWLTCMYLHTWQHQMTTIMQPFQCDLQPQIQETHRTTYINGHNHLLQNTEEEPITSGTTPAATAAHTRYFSSPAEATLHGKMQDFVPRLPTQNKAHTTFMQPLQCVSEHSLHHHFPSSPLPLVTTSQSHPLRHHFPKSPHPLCHHLPSSPLPKVTTLPLSQLPLVITSQSLPESHHTPFATTCQSHRTPFVTTSLGHHFPKLARKSPHSLCHHFPKSPHSLCHHLPSSPFPSLTVSQSHHTPFVTASQTHHTPFVTTSLRHHFPSSPLPFVTTLCHSLLFFCGVLLCDVKSHTALHQCQVSQFYLSVTRKYCFPTSFE